MNKKGKNIKIYFLTAFIVFGLLWAFFKDYWGFIFVFTGITVLVSFIYKNKSYHSISIYIFILCMNFLGLLSVAYFTRNNIISDILIVLLIVLFSLDAKSKLYSWRNQLHNKQK